ncbi:MAG: D-glycerate dehydrogenase [Melioribacteraceae bacterium]|nr:D-glycerate dehydrogenase [Melioribacteraceae bacterium]MCF8263644.1 D-glycerate dehydrogenase [Melioribacteraceae bacterium]MCF8431430.1 D-glycerate dehydrogenase [Melioribacteraceae bacterium]
MKITNKKKILLTRIFPGIARELLENAGYFVSSSMQDAPLTKLELIRMSKSHDAIMCTLSDRIDSEFLTECAHLDIISQFAVGFDNIDLIKATELNIPVGYTPDVLSDATADLAFGLMIAVSRNMIYNYKRILNGEWKYFRPNSDLGIELKNKTLGIYGLGRIGFEMAKRCKGAFDMKILYNNRSRNQKAEDQLDARFVDFSTLLAESDIISVHAALNPETKSKFNKTAFDKMKPTALFINTARGGIHDEYDLIKAMEMNQFWGAGLDVTNPEPCKPDNPLLSMPNVVVLPHIGSATVEARSAMAKLAAENIIEFYEKGTVPNIINYEVISSIKR